MPLHPPNFNRFRLINPNGKRVMEHDLNYEKGGNWWRPAGYPDDIQVPPEHSKEHAGLNETDVKAVWVRLFWNDLQRGLRRDSRADSHAGDVSRRRCVGVTRGGVRRVRGPVGHSAWTASLARGQRITGAGARTRVRRSARIAERCPGGEAGYSRRRSFAGCPRTSFRGGTWPSA